MLKNWVTDGFVWLAVGFFLSSISSLLEHLGSTAGFAQGFLDGLAAVAFAAALVLMVSRARRNG